MQQVMISFILLILTCDSEGEIKCYSLLWIIELSHDFIIYDVSSEYYLMLILSLDL